VVFFYYTHARMHACRCMLEEGVNLRFHCANCMNPCGPNPEFVAASKDSLESMWSRIESPGSWVGFLMLDCSFARTSLKGLGMKRVMRVMVWDSSCVVAIVAEDCLLSQVCRWWRVLRLEGELIA
jgi:hypothetical protein